jgi:hypothetical protein
MPLFSDAFRVRMCENLPLKPLLPEIDPSGAHHGDPLRERISAAHTPCRTEEQYSAANKMHHKPYWERSQCFSKTMK